MKKKKSTAAVVLVLILLFVAALPLSASSITLGTPVVSCALDCAYEYIGSLSASSSQAPDWTFLIVYDVVGYVPASAFTTATDWFFVGTAPLGPDPFLQGPPDSPAVENLVWVYTGLTVPGPLVLGTFGFHSIYGPGGTGFYAAQDIRSSDGAAQGNSGIIELDFPTSDNPHNPVPEPQTLMYVGTGLALIFGARRKTVLAS